MITFIKKLLGITDLEYKIRLLQRKKVIGEININMVKKIKKVAKALKKASALHKKQSKVIEKHIKEMKSYGKKKRS